MSRTWFWSDLHLGHDFVAKTRGFNDGPVLSASKSHDHHIALVWRRHIKPKDHIWLLGDISGGRNEDYALEFIGAMPGIKHLISGNHDSVSSINRNAWKQQAKFLEVFASVQDFARMKTQGVNFLLSHYPYEGDHKDVERYSDYRLSDEVEGKPLVHGHVHDAWDYSITSNGTPMMNVGVDHWFDQPASIEDIIEWLKIERRIGNA